MTVFGSSELDRFRRAEKEQVWFPGLAVPEAEARAHRAHHVGSWSMMAWRCQAAFPTGETQLAAGRPTSGLRTSLSWHCWDRHQDAQSCPQYAFHTDGSGSWSRPSQGQRTLSASWAVSVARSWTAMSTRVSMGEGLLTDDYAGWARLGWKLVFGKLTGKQYQIQHVLNANPAK